MQRTRDEERQAQHHLDDASGTLGPRSLVARTTPSVKYTHTSRLTQR
jgi:hypothetical protein